MAAINKDVVLVISLVLSVVSLVLLFGVTWYFQSSLDLLQQQVEYDRELLFKLQEQINLHTSLKSTTDDHDVLKRQAENDCQCKDGLPGVQGPPGNKGEQGKRGKRGSAGKRGEVGPRGEIGEKGEKGEAGQRGDPGDRGPRGLIGDTGLRGPDGEAGIPGAKGDKGEQGEQGEAGIPGAKGDKGDQGPISTKGDKGDPGPIGLKGQMGYQGIKGAKGEKGSSGLTGSTGLTGPKGTPGQKGMKGDKEERNGGTVYVRWGHNQCPSTARLVYSGRAGGSWYSQSGGGSNPQCLPLNPNFLKPIRGSQHGRALIYGAEYETLTDSNSHVHGHQNTDIPCAVCHSNHNAVYMVPAKYTCPSGWTREYYGYLMAEYYGHHRSQYTCMDTAFKSVTGSSANKDGLLFYFVEGRCGSLPCPPYDNTKELSCAVCTK